MIIHNANVLILVKRWVGIFLAIAVPLELVLFWSPENLAGALMTIVCSAIFIQFLHVKYIMTSPFAFLMYLSTFMYRFLPLIATLIEGNPISVGFERPYETFLFETLLFLVSSAAFWFTARISLRRKNNRIQKVLFKIGFFKITRSTIWALGAIGFVVRLYTFSAGTAEYGDVGGKFIDGLKYLLYAPLTLFFADLVGLPRYSKTKWVWTYLIVVFIVSIASNSRSAMISPIAIYLILFFLHLVKNNITLWQIISPMKLLVLLFFLVFGAEMLSDFSLAMLYNRNARSDISRSELFARTIETYQNKKLLTHFKSLRNDQEGFVENYQEGWTETYIDNFMLNRYANLRITDQTLYYADKRGYRDPEMIEDFSKQLLFTFPAPLLSLLGVKVDKSNNEYSRGDLLYGSALGSYKVTSHIGDGMVTFGLWYFPMQFLASIAVFYLLNSLVIFRQEETLFSAFGLMNVFSFLGFFRNSNGILVDVVYVLRGFWQGIFTYFTILLIINYCINSPNRKK